MLITFSPRAKDGSASINTLVSLPSGVGFPSKPAPAQLRTHCCSRADYSLFMQGGKRTQCRWLSLIIGRASSPECLISADQQRCAIRAKARSLWSGRQSDSPGHKAAAEAGGAHCTGCTQQVQAGPGAAGASGPQRHQCQGGKAICAIQGRGTRPLCHRSPSLVK